MARTILTERDVDEFARQGATEICVNDDIYLTDLARERAEKLGLPVRTVAGAVSPTTTGEKEQLVAKVKAGVIARLGAGVDEKMVETIVRRVVGQL